jgi:nucleotide-binding universal stress UspA family protein
MTDSLLVPFDGSPSAQRALELAAGYLGPGRPVSATVLNVQPRALRLWPGPGLDPAALERAAAEAGERELRPALERLPGARGEVRLGAPAEAILHEARAHHLIVMGTRGAGALAGYAIGSVALRVAHGSAEAPVVLVKPQDRLPEAPGRRLRVLLAMDGSPAALRAAARLAAWRGWLGELDVQLLWVQAPLSYLSTVLPPHDDVVGQWSQDEGRQATQDAAALLQREGIAHRVHLSVGDPGSARSPRRPAPSWWRSARAAGARRTMRSSARWR